jgi:hypothetical protein
MNHKSDDARSKAEAPKLEHEASDHIGWGPSYCERAPEAYLRENRRGGFARRGSLP